MRKTAKKISLHRETLRTLAGEELSDAKGGDLTLVASCYIICNTISCVTHCNCPTMVQNCTTRC